MAERTTVRCPICNIICQEPGLTIYYHFWKEHMVPSFKSWHCLCGADLDKEINLYAWDCLKAHCDKHGGLQAHMLDHLMGVTDGKA